MYLDIKIFRNSKMTGRGKLTSTTKPTRTTSSLSSPAIRWSLQVFLVLILNQIHQNFGSPVFTYNPSITQFHIQSGRNIRHLPCVVRRSGIEGVCMFAIDCIKANGTHLGTCIDRFYFGSCCQLKDDADIVESEIVENSIDQNTIPHFSFGSPITSTTVNSFHSMASSTPRTTSTTKGQSTSPKPIVTSTIQHQKLTTLNQLSSSSSLSSPTPQAAQLSSIKPETTTVKFVPITTILNTESKTDSSNEQIIIEKLPETTNRNSIASNLPTTTEENIKLQTFQSVQETTFTSPSPVTTQKPTSTTPKKPSRRPTTTATTIAPKVTTQSTQTQASSTVSSSTTKPSRPVTTTISTTPKATSVQSSTKHTPISSTSLPKRPEQTQTLKPTTKPIPQKTTSNQPITTASTEKTISTGASKFPPTNIVSSTQASIITSNGTRTTPPQKKKPTATTASFVSSTTTTLPPKLNATKTAAKTTTTTTTLPPTTARTTKTTTTTSTTTEMPDLVTWSHAETVKTEHPPEWILIPSVQPQSNIAQTTSVPSSNKPTIPSSNQIVETTRFPTRKPINSSSKAPVTKKPTSKPSTIETTATKPSTKKPQTSASTTTTTTTTSPTTTSTEKLPITTNAPKITSTQSTTTVLINTELHEEMPLTTESVTMFDEFEETTSFTEISETENVIINHATSTAPSSNIHSTSTIGNITMSKVNSTVIASSTESNVISSSSSSSTEHADGRPSAKPTVATTQPPITLTTILLPPSIKPDYEKLPTIKPIVSDKVEMTTVKATTTTPTSTTIAPSAMDSSSTIAYNRTTPQPSSSTSTTTESSDKLTTMSNKIESTTGETNTVGDIATSSVPLTTFETYDVENTTAENVTLEFVDLPTTEAILTTSSISQYLETANYKQVCGKRMYPEPRIVGGSKASFGRWPWQISLRQWRTSTYLHKCGAALLNENWAITAAHCVDNVPPSDLLLRLGEYDLAEEEEPYLYQERRVQIVASHPQFDPRTFEYDLALLRFYEPVVFQPNIIPVCVPDSDENFIGRTAFVTGWGRLYEDGPLPSVLQEVSVPVINNTLCEGMYRNAGYIEHIPHIFICAGWRKGGYDSCEGDSGGPMVIQREDKRFLLAGVISWGIGCAEPNQPGVYTRISEFREWINQILQF